MKIAIGSKSRTGKDTIADILLQEYGGTKLAFSDALYDISGYVQEKLSRPVQKDPKLLQTIGESLKDVYGRSVWVTYLENELRRTKGNIFVTDLRFPEEWEMLKKNGFLMINVERPDRPITRDPNHISEIALDKNDFVWDFIVCNDGSLDDLKEKVFEISNLIFKK